MEIGKEKANSSTFATGHLEKDIKDFQCFADNLSDNERQVTLMSVQLSSIVSSSFSSTSSVSPASNAQPTAKVSAPPTATTDSVKLSVSGRVHQLRSQGQSATQIANSLGLTATLVSSYLGSSTPQVSVAVPTVPSPATQATTAGPQSSSTPR